MESLLQTKLPLVLIPIIHEAREWQSILESHKRLALQHLVKQNGPDARVF